jgi:hypothetical protein
MKNLVILIYLTILIMSCKGELPIPGFNTDAGLEVSVTDSAGNDLLDSTQAGAIDISKIKRYYLDENGKKIEFYHSYLESPRGIVFYPKDEFQKINLLAFWIDDTNDYSTTLIEWNEARTDTITADIIRGKNYVYARNVKYNSAIVEDTLQAVYERTGYRYYPIVWE